MVAGGLLEKPRPVFHRSHLFIARAEIDAPDSCERDRSRAHDTGFERDIEIAVGEALRAALGRCLAQHQHFRMGGGVFQFQCAVTGAGQRCHSDKALREQPLEELIAGPLSRGWVGMFEPYRAVHKQNLERVLELGEAPWQA